MSINKPYCFLQIQLKACSHYLNPNSPRLWAITASLQVALYLLLTLILIKAFINSSFLPHQRKRGIIKIGILFFIWACTFFLIDPSFSPRDKLCPIFLRKYSLFAIQTAVFPSCTTYMQRGTGRKNKAYIKKKSFSDVCHKFNWAQKSHAKIWRCFEKWARQIEVHTKKKPSLLLNAPH